MKKLSWKPIRKGKLYCSPACGGHCLISEYEEMTKEAAKVAAELGSAWKPRIWENLGWHWAVQATAGEFTLAVHQCKNSGYQCMISTIPGVGLPGIYADGYYPTAKKAVAESMMVFSNKAQQYLKARVAMDVFWMQMPSNRKR